MGEPSIFGRRLKAARKKHGLTQSELAEEAGVSATAVSHFETGERQFPSADNLVKFADALGISTDYLLGQVEADQYSEAVANALLRRTRLDEASEDVLQTIEQIADALIEKEQAENGDHG